MEPSEQTARGKALSGRSDRSAQAGSSAMVAAESDVPLIGWAPERVLAGYLLDGPPSVESNKKEVDEKKERNRRKPALHDEAERRLRGLGKRREGASEEAWCLQR